MEIVSSAFIADRVSGPTPVKLLSITSHGKVAGGLVLMSQKYIKELVFLNTVRYTQPV